MDYEAARRNMIESQIRTNKVTHRALLDALASLPRVAGDDSPRLGATASTESQIRAWKEWFRNRPVIDLQ